MKKTGLYLALLFLAFNLSRSATDSIPGIGKVTPNFDSTFQRGVYVPEDMFDCFVEIDKLLPRDVRDSVYNLDYGKIYGKYGRLTQWIYINWGLADSSRIYNFFEKYGFTNPSTIAHGIFESYWKYKHSEPIRIEIKPDAYVIDKNLHLKEAEEFVFPEKRPNPKGTIVPTDSTPQFIFMGRHFTLIDSLYDPIINMIKENGLQPSDSLWYIWWPRIAKFGEGIDSLPSFINKEEFDEKFSPEDSYNADFILILQDSKKYKIKGVIRENKFNEEFKNYVKNKKHLGIYLIRKREVARFEF